MLPYYPGLRFKKGEYTAVAKLAADIRRYVEPRFVIPPPKEYDHELGRAPTIDEIAHLTGERIGKNWPVGRAFIDTQFLAGELSDDGLRELFRLAQARNSMLVPVATLGNVTKPLFRSIQCAGSIKLGLLISYEEADVHAIGNALSAAGLTAPECILFIDFTGAPLRLDIAVGSVSGIFDLVDQVGRWQKIVFQASNFPARNPAPNGGDELVSRNEWAVFHAALTECGISPGRVGYGDYAGLWGNGISSTQIHGTSDTARTLYGREAHRRCSRSRRRFRQGSNERRLSADRG